MKKKISKIPALVIGTGLIGKKVCEMLRKGVSNGGSELELVGSFDRQHWYPEKENGPTSTTIQKFHQDRWLDNNEVKVVFLCISTLDDGKIARDLIVDFCERGCTVITCEKGALANYWPDLYQYIQKSKLLFNASVSGGTRALPVVREEVVGNPLVKEMHLIMNGTMNFVTSFVATSGQGIGFVMEQARSLGLTEPNPDTGTLELINGEVFSDLPLKTRIVANVLSGTKDGARETFRSPEKEPTVDLARFVRDARTHRLIVSFYRNGEGCSNEPGTTYTFRGAIGDWYVRSGFKPITSVPAFRLLCQGGASNGIAVVKGSAGENGTTVKIGQGAGAGPTAQSMIEDWLKA